MHVDNVKHVTIKINSFEFHKFKIQSVHVRARTYISASEFELMVRIPVA